ncbi:MAG: GNAT family N-acetyltransferase [Deltaproteobacteria bacterium]|nr:GNAT family N-acetyltransferase [Deltaproteobacteria bacterium]
MQEYRQKLRTAEEAIAMIHSGQRVFISSTCGSPRHLVDALIKNRDRFSDLEILRLLSMEATIDLTKHRQELEHIFSFRSIYQGSGRTEQLQGIRRFLTPMGFSSIPRLFRSRKLPINCALIQVSPPDEYGWMSLGVSVDITRAAAQAADLVIAQVNPQMPRINGNSFLHVRDINIFVEWDAPLPAVQEHPETEAARKIAELVACLIEDGATIHVGLSEYTGPILRALKDKRDLGVHTQFMTDGFMHLMTEGVITNRYKSSHEGKLVAESAIGGEELYRFLHNHPAIEFHPADYVNNPIIIAQQERMTSVNAATAIDLTGQIAADALPENYFSGVSGMADFVIGALANPEGKSMIVLSAATSDGKKSNIVPELDCGAVFISKSYIQYVITEYGMVNLFGKSLQERAMALISIAHPAFREDLFRQAGELGLISPERTLNESLFGVYPVWLEEIRDYGGVRVTFRPVKPTDIRPIQEHFYTMDDKDVATRFFQLRSTFYQEQLADMYQVDYIKNMTIVAATGEGGLERVIAVGEYNLEPAQNRVEVAFSVSKDWQGKGIAHVILTKLAQAAMGNGFSGMAAYTSHRNAAMIRLFKKLPYAVKTALDDDFFVLSCEFGVKQVI